MSVWDAHFKAVSSVAFAAGDALVLSGGQDAVINVWLVAQLVAIGAAASAGGGSSMMPQPVASFSAHSLPITSLYVGIGGQQARIASSSLDRTCKVWDLGTKELVCSIMFPEAIVCATCDVAETALFAGSTSGNIYIVDLTAPSYSASSDTAASASAVASASMSFHCSDRVFSGHTYVSINLPTMSAISCSSSDSLPLDLAHVPCCNNNSKTITSLAVSADGTLLISCSQDTTARVWHIGSGQTIRIFTQHRRTHSHPDRASLSFAQILTSRRLSRRARARACCRRHHGLLGDVEAKRVLVDRASPSCTGTASHDAQVCCRSRS